MNKLLQYLYFLDKYQHVGRGDLMAYARREAPSGRYLGSTVTVSIKKKPNVSVCTRMRWNY